jgi:hypothetical protein
VTLLTAITTHLPPEHVREQLDYLKELSPSSRFVVCYGGSRAGYDELRIRDALFVSDDGLREASQDQSYNGILRAVHENCVAPDPALELVYFIEFDQLILSGDFEEALTALSERSEAGLFAKAASPRNDTNWLHYLRFRDDASFNGFIAEISRRDDPKRRYGCLGTGMLFRREALAAFASATAGAPHAYLELFIPTVVYHLGFDVEDVDALGDLYGAMRWRPEYTLEEAIAEKRAGRIFVHPFKRLDALDTIRQAPARAQNFSTAGSSG